MTIDILETNDLNDFFVDCEDGMEFQYEGQAYRVIGHQDFVEEYGREQTFGSIYECLPDMNKLMSHTCIIEKIEMPVATEVTVENTPETQLVSVYGSLRKGMGNNGVMVRAEGKYVGTGTIVEPAAMYSLGGFPFLTFSEEETDLRPESVVVEVYEVRNDMMGGLHRLEGHYGRGHKSNFYDLKDVDVDLKDEEGNTTETVTAGVYFIDQTGGRYARVLNEETGLSDWVEFKNEERVLGRGYF